MLVIPIDGPADVFCDNQSVVTNLSILSSVLNKKYTSICYHRVREAHTAGKILVGWISGEYNKDDIGTKTRKTKRRYKLLNQISNEKGSTITKNSHGVDSETQVPSLMEVSKYLLYREKPWLKSGSEYEC